MTPEQKARIANTLSIKAELAGTSFSQGAIVEMVNALDDLDFESVNQILSDWSRTEIKFPHPSLIRAKLAPELDDADNAQDVANLILSNVSKCGYTNPERARQNIGELAWATVVGMGGWKHLCESLTVENEGMYRAQIRSYAVTVIKKAKRGELNTAPALPQSGSSIQNLISQTFKSIEKAGG